MPTPSLVSYIFSIVFLTILTGCGQWLGGRGAEIVLEGERLDVLGSGSNLSIDKRVKDLDVILPRPEINNHQPVANRY